MMLSNGSGLRFEANARVKIKRFLQEPFLPEETQRGFEPSRSQILIEVERGGVIFHTPRLIDGSRAEFVVPGANIRVYGGRYLLSVESTRTVFSVIKGKADVICEGHQTAVQVTDEQEAVVIRAQPGTSANVRISDIALSEIDSLFKKTEIANPARQGIFSTSNSGGGFPFVSGARQSVLAPPAEVIVEPNHSRIVRTLRGETTGVILHNGIGLWLEPQSEIEISHRTEQISDFSGFPDVEPSVSETTITIKAGTVALAAPKLLASSTLLIESPAGGAVLRARKVVIDVEPLATEIKAFEGTVTSSAADPGANRITANTGEKIILRQSHVDRPATATASRILHWEKVEQDGLIGSASFLRRQNPLLKWGSITKSPGESELDEVSPTSAFDPRAERLILPDTDFDRARREMDRDALDWMVALLRSPAAVIICVFALILATSWFYRAKTHLKICQALFGTWWRFALLLWVIPTGLLASLEKPWRHGGWGGFLTNAALLAALIAIPWLETVCTKLAVVWRRLARALLRLLFIVVGALQLGVIVGLLAQFTGMDAPWHIESAAQWLLGDISSATAARLFGSGGPSWIAASALTGAGAMILITTLSALVAKTQPATAFERWHSRNLRLTAAVLLLALGLWLALSVDHYTLRSMVPFWKTVALASFAGLVMAQPFIWRGRKGPPRQPAAAVDSAISAKTVVKFASSLAVTATIVSATGLISTTKDDTSGALTRLRNAYAIDYVRARWDKVQQAVVKMGAESTDPTAFKPFARPFGYVMKEPMIAVIDHIGVRRMNEILNADRPAWLLRAELTGAPGVVQFTELRGGKEWSGRVNPEVEGVADKTFQNCRMVIESLGGAIDESMAVTNPEADFPRIERPLIERKLTVPFLNIDVPYVLASGFSFALLCCIIVFLCDQLRLVTQLQRSQIEEEPLLLLAGVTTLSRSFRSIWALALMIAPHALFVQMLREINLYYAMRGSNVGLGTDAMLILVMLGCLALAITTLVRSAATYAAIVRFYQTARPITTI